MRKPFNEDHDLVATFARDRAGTTAIEYAVLAAGIAMAIVLSVEGVGSAVLALFVSVKSSF